MKAEKWLTGGALAGLALLARLVGLAERGLWYDELQSVTFASLPVQELFASVLEFDPHPPLYYLQLHFWMQAGVSDVWIKLNSVAWSVGALAVLYFVSSRLYGQRTAALAAFLFALSPFAVVAGQDARMYAFLMFWGLGCFWFIRQFLGEKASWGNALGMGVCALVFLYSHGAGFVVLASMWGYGGLEWLQNGEKNWGTYGRLGLVQAVVLGLYLPWLSRARTIEVGHTLIPGLKDFLRTLDILFFGYGPPLSPQVELFQWAGGTLVVLTVVYALLTGRERNPLLAFTVLPVVFCLGVSYAVRPIWLYRTLAFTTPFLCLAGGMVLSRLKGVRSRWATGLVAGLVVFMLGVQQATFEYRWDFRAAVEFVRAHGQAGDRVYIPNERVLWGWAWYAAGPGRVNPLERGAAVEGQGRVVISTSPPLLEEGQAIWVVYREGDDPSPFEVGGADLEAEFRGLNTIRIPPPGAP